MKSKNNNNLKFLILGCKLYHPDDEISIRLALHEPCKTTINGLPFHGTYQKSCPGVQHLSKSLIDKVCDREICKDWYCCPNDDINVNSLSSCDLDVYHRKHIEYVGPVCHDTLLGRGEGTCRPRNQCHSAGTKIYDKCFVKGGVEFVCCPNINFERRPRTDQSCKEFSATPFTHHKRVVRPLADQFPPLCVWNKNNSQKIEAEPLEYPHAAILGYKSLEMVNVLEWRCSGSLISDRFVLTAANCLLTKYGPVQLIRLGVIQLTDNFEADDCPEDYGASEQIPHPNYSAITDTNDIGLIRLDRRVQFSPYVRPICLPATGEIPREGHALKWGVVGSTPGRGDIMLKIKQDISDFTACNREYDNVLSASTQFCANSMEVGGYFLSSTCSVFSGGPMSHEHPELDQMHVLFGVVSFGRECQPSNLPGVYTKVYPFTKWITEIVFGANNF